MASSYAASLKLPIAPQEIADNGFLERTISTSGWVENLTKDKKTRISFHPLQTTVTQDAENITPGESIVFIKSRKEDDSNASQSTTLAVASLRAASEIMNSIASTNLLHYTMYSRRNLVPLFLSSSKRGEFGKGKTIKSSMMRRYFFNKKAVDDLLKELNEKKINAAKAFIKAVSEKSVVNMALAAWSAGNAGNLYHLIEVSKLMYGPERKYKNAGMFRNTAAAASTSRFNCKEYLDEIKRKHKGTLNFDSAQHIFNNALNRIFTEFKDAVKSSNEKDPLLRAVRQHRRPGDGDLDKMGMLVPRTKFSVADYMIAEKKGEDKVLMKLSTDLENSREGRKRKADTDLKNTLAKGLADSAAVIDASAVKTSADLEINSNELEWSMHITQLFSQAFLETMSSLLSSSFGVENPFSEQGFQNVENIIRKRKDDRNVDMNPAVLANDYLLFTGNFNIPFHVSDSYDVVEGRQVCPNTPILTIVTHHKTKEEGTVTNIELRDRLLVNDELLNKAITTPFTAGDNMGEDGKPMLGGCLPVIRGPPQKKQRTEQEHVDDIVNSLANDWYISTGVYYNVGKTSAAICAGYHRALASTDKSGEEEKTLKKAMRRNTDRFTRLSVLLGQTISKWDHQEHNSSIDSFWSSSAAVQSKTAQDALSRSQIIGVRKQIDGKGGWDELNVAEQGIRNMFYDKVSRNAGYDIDVDFSKYSGWLQNDDITRKSWEEYIASMADLSENERRLFNIGGLFSAINMFKFPLLASEKPHVLKNLKAADRIINGLSEMIIQSAFNCSSTDEIKGLGSAANGWGPANNQLQPSRMRALKLMAKFGRDRSDVISIPVSLGRITSVNIPAVIMIHLISDKRILDSLCGKIDLKNEIMNFIQTLARGETKKSILATGKYAIILLRYIWFNTAIISLTNNNITMPINLIKEGLGDALFEDYISIRTLVNNYNVGISNYSIDKISKHYLDANENEHKYNIIDSDKKLTDVLTFTDDALNAFVTNEKRPIKSISTVEMVKNTPVIIKELSKIISVEKVQMLFVFLLNIGQLNDNIKDYLEQLSLGEGLSKSELDNFKHPNIAQLFHSKLNADIENKPSEHKRDIIIDLNKPGVIEIEEKIKTLSPDAVEELTFLKAELEERQIPSLKNSITVPGYLTADHAFNIVDAFTKDGRLSNRSTQMKILMGAIRNVRKDFEENVKEDDRLDISINKVGQLVQNILLFCFICAHSSAGSTLIGHIEDFSKFLSHLVAETSLSVSRLQSSFYPLPPLVFSLSGMILPDPKKFEEIVKEYVTEIVKKLTAFKKYHTHCGEELSSSSSDLDDDDTSSTILFKASKIFNKERKASSFSSNFIKNPASVWSSSALPHFDVAIVPKFQPGITADQLFRLSTYYHGMHKISDYSKPPPHWDTLLAGNKAGQNFGLGEISENKRSFNAALDTLLTLPMEICSLISKEIVRTSNDVVHNIGSSANKDRIEQMLQIGPSVVKPLSSSGKSCYSSSSFPFRSSIKETLSAFFKSRQYGLMEDDVIKDIVKKCDTSSMINHSKEIITSKQDVVKAPMGAVTAFRQNVVKATKAVYELAAVCSVMSKDKSARISSREIMKRIKETSPVIEDIDIGRMAGLIGTVVSPKQYKQFLQAVSEHKNSIDKHYARRIFHNNLSDQFWMDVFDGGEEVSKNFDDAVYGSRVNTYAAVSNNVDRLKDDSSVDEQQKTDKRVTEIEKYISEIKSGSTLTTLIDAQHMYRKLSCIITDALSPKNNGDQSNNVLAAMLHELASRIYETEPELASRLALAGHIILAKALKLKLNGNREMTYNHLLSVAGVKEYAHFSANVLCQRLTSNDIKLFLGATTMLQQGLFITFLLNDIIFTQTSDSLKTENLSPEVKSKLVALVDFCEIISKTFNIRQVRRRLNMDRTSEDEKLDASFVSALYLAYKDFRKKKFGNNEALAAFFDDIKPHNKVLKTTSMTEVMYPKRNSTLTDVLEAPSSIQKSFMKSFSEKSAASRQVKRHTRCDNDTAAFLNNEICDYSMDDYDDFSDEAMSISSDSSITSSSSSDSDGDSEEDIGGRGGGYSYDASDRLDDDTSGSSDLEDSDENDHGGDISRRRSERIQYGPGFLSHSFLFNHPPKARAFLGKKLKTSGFHYQDDDEVIFSDEYSDDEEGGCKDAEKQSAFVRRVTRMFIPTKISLVNGRVSLISPVGTDTPAGFYKTYQRSNKKEREELRGKFNIDSLSQSDKYESPSDLRRSLIKATSDVLRTQSDNVGKIYEAIVSTTTRINDPTNVLADKILFSQQLKNIIDKRNKLLTNLTDSSLFTSSVSQGPENDTVERARNLITAANVPGGYLGVPLRNLSNCLKKTAINSDNVGGVGISVDSMLSISNKSHLDWLTAAALAFTRSFNVTTFHAIEYTLKTNSALQDMYNAFNNLITSHDGKKIRIKSTLLDSIFNARMSHTESVLGLVCPNAFINHELPSDPKQRKEIESDAFNVLRGVNSGQTLHDKIDNTSGLLSYLTSTTFAGRGGERGGLSLYRMSITEALSCEPTQKRLKGAVSLEVGPWTMCDDAVFSRRSKKLVKYCSEKFLSLENAVGPIARFIPNGTTLELVGLTNLPPMKVADDPAMLRLQSAELAPGRFIAASAIGNLYGKIDDILNLAKKFVVRDIIFSSAENTHLKNIKDVAKDIVSKMKARRNKSLKTSFGDTVISQATNYPATSEAIVLRARETRNAISTIVSDISNKHGVSRNSWAGGVSVKAFERILETSAVLANTKMTLRGFENRLAAAYTRLRQFKSIANDGMSEARAVIFAVAETMNTLDRNDNGEKATIADFMKDDEFFKFIVNSELKNIEDAKRHITSAIEGACCLHAKMLSMLASVADINGGDESQLLNDDIHYTGRGGVIIKHPNTGIWLKTDEECNLINNDDNDKRSARSILTMIENNRKKALRSKLHTMYSGKYSIYDIFAMDDVDTKIVDKLIEKLNDAVTCRISPVASSSDPVNTADDISTPSNAPVGKRIPYIPIIFENKHEEKKNQASTNVAKLQKNALEYLEAQEANDLSNILNIASKHKFVSHDQAATVAIFNAAEGEEKTDVDSVQFLMSRLPTVVASEGCKPPPFSAAAAASPPPPSSSILSKLQKHAETMASDLKRFEEYKNLLKISEKINSAINHLEIIRNQSFFTENVSPEIKQDIMATLSQSQSAKDRAIQLFEAVLKHLEEYTPDQSVSVPISSSEINNSSIKNYLTYAYEKLQVAKNDRLENNSIERDGRVRIPLLLSYHEFVSTLNQTVSNFGEYYQLIKAIRQKIPLDAENALSFALEQTEKKIDSDTNSILFVLDTVSDMYSDEADALQTTVNLLEHKKNELETKKSSISSSLDKINKRIEAGEKFNRDDLLVYEEKMKKVKEFLESLKKFFRENSGVVFTVKEHPEKILNDDEYVRDAINSINEGQQTAAAVVTLDDSLCTSPEKITSIQLAQTQERNFLESIQKYINAFNDRILKLKTRLIKSTEESKTNNDKKNNINIILMKQREQEYDNVRTDIENLKTVALTALENDSNQITLSNTLSDKVEKLLRRINRVGGETFFTEKKDLDQNTAALKTQKKLTILASCLPFMRRSNA